MTDIIDINEERAKRIKSCETEFAEKYKELLEFVKRERFQIRSHNGGLFRKATIGLSTVELLPIPSILPYHYESCLFSNNGSEVLARYETEVEAIIGHEKLRQQLGLSPGV